MRIGRGFTLVELIVVIAVLTVLLALVVPSLKSGKESGVALVCTNHLKQLNLITSIYCEETQSFPQGFCSLPECVHTRPEGGYPGNQSYDWPGWWWFNYLAVEDLSKDGTLWCPARKRMAPIFFKNILWSNYGINYSIAKWASFVPSGEFEGPPLRKIEIRQPADTLLYTDSGYALISWKAATEGIEHPFDINTLRENSFYLPGLDMNKDRLIHSEQKEDAVKGRHPNQTVNIAFVDGHVKKEKAELLFVEQDEQAKPLAGYIWSPGR